MGKPDNNPRLELAEFLTTRREQLRLSQVEIAKRTGGVCKPAYICSYETGVRDIPIERIVVVAEAYEISPLEIARRSHRLGGIFKSGPTLPSVDLETKVHLGDLEYLTVVAKGLAQSMTLSQLVELLRLRQPLE